MAKNKTAETTKSVTAFINAVKDETRRKDSFQLVEIMKKKSGFDAKMWGPSIIGFGNYHYKYDSGHEGDIPLIGFSPRSTAIVFYFWGSLDKREDQLRRLGKHKSGKGCVYVKKLQDINLDVLNEMIDDTMNFVKSRYTANK
jgi:uncharacterized protein DUF1801